MMPPSLREQSVFLNSAIDTLYEELAAVKAQRNPRAKQPKLEEYITFLLERIKSLQKQEGDLVQAAMKAHLAGPIAQGWALLSDAEEFLKDYEPGT